jgi:DNA-binding beta-propeller fold protein YncE
MGTVSDGSGAKVKRAEASARFGPEMNRGLPGGATLVFRRRAGFLYRLARRSGSRPRRIGIQEERVQNQSRWYRLIAFAPAVLLLAMMAVATSCGKSLYSSSGSSSSATNTPVPGQGNFAYVTNYNAGEVSEFSRNITSGALKQIATIAAGAKKGPAGIAVDPSNKYVYAVNAADGNLYAYSIGAKGVLSSLGSFSDGVNSQPQQVVVSPSSNFLWVSDYAAHQITIWTLTSGVPTSPTTFSGTLHGPFGMAVNTAGTFLYVADLDQGLIYWFSVDTSTGALTLGAGSPIASQYPAVGEPAQLAIDPTGFYLVEGEQADTSPVVSLFTINSVSGALTYAGYSPTASSQPFGLAWAISGSNTYLFTANQNTSNPSLGSIGAYVQLVNGSLSVTTGVNSVNGPTDVIVDPQNTFAYSTNQGDGTIGQYTLNGSCGQSICFTTSFKAIKNYSGNPAPYWIALTH